MILKNTLVLDNNKFLSLEKKELLYLKTLVEIQGTKLISAYQTAKTYRDKIKFQSSEKDKRAEELDDANIELKYQNLEKGKRAMELFHANHELQLAVEHQKQFSNTLEEMMFIISHKIRHPLSKIMAASTLLENDIHCTSELYDMINIIKKSAVILEDFTRELSIYVNEKRKIEK